MAARDPTTGQFVSSDADTEIRRMSALIDVPTTNETYTFENNNEDRMIVGVHLSTSPVTGGATGKMEAEISESAQPELVGTGGASGILNSDLTRSPVMDLVTIFQDSGNGFATLDDHATEQAVRWDRGQEIHVHTSNNLGEDNALEVIVYYVELE